MKNSAPLKIKKTSLAADSVVKKRQAKANTGGLEDIRDAVSRLKRERIISTAVELFHQNGMSKTTLEKVAIQMNVTKPFIYSHFKSKNELLAEICSSGIRASLDVLDAVISTDLSPTEKIIKLINDFMLTVIENQGYLAIYSREEKNLTQESRKKINTMRREFDKKFCALLEDGVVSGEFEIKDIQLTSLSIDGIISWSYVWYRPNGRLSAQQTASAISNLVLKMIAPSPTKSKV